MRRWPIVLGGGGTLTAAAALPGASGLLTLAMISLIAMAAAVTFCPQERPFERVKEMLALLRRPHDGTASPAASSPDTPATAISPAPEQDIAKATPHPAPAPAATQNQRQTGKRRQPDRQRDKTGGYGNASMAE